MTRTYWLSFSAGEEKPEGQRHLGCVVVEVTQKDVEAVVAENPRIAHSDDGGWAAAAGRLCWVHKVNPGGEYAFLRIPDDQLHKLAQFPRFKLLTREFVEAMDKMT